MRNLINELGTFVRFHRRPIKCYSRGSLVRLRKYGYTNARCCGGVYVNFVRLSLVGKKSVHHNKNPRKFLLLVVRAGVAVEIVDSFVGTIDTEC